MSDHNPITPLTPGQFTSAKANVPREGYIHRDLVAVDQMANVLTDGLPDETISSRAARASLRGKLWGKALSSFLNLFQKNHGAKAQAGDVARAEEVIAVENKSGDL